MPSGLQGAFRIENPKRGAGDADRAVEQDETPPLWNMTVAEASTAVQAGRISPIELVEAFLDRIATVDDEIHSYIHVARDRALEEARRAADDLKAGRRRGPLHGLPYAVKDNYDAAGLPATAGSRLRQNHVPERDAVLVEKLRDGGAVLLGKLSTWEYGTGNGGEYFDLPFPPARNPWDTSRFTGGSSTGAGVAVAAATAMFALGSDTTGSVRLPAAATGVVGIIPTQGHLSLEGILPNCYSLDVPGLLTWTAEDAAIVLDALVGDPTDPARAAVHQRAISHGLAGSRIAVVRDPGPGLPAPEAAIAQALEAGLAILRELGAHVTEIRLPTPAAECFAATSLIGPAESASIHEAELRDRADEMGFALRDKLLKGSVIRAVDYIAAQRRRLAIAQSLDSLMQKFDALVTYGSLHLPPRLGVEPEMTAFTMETMLTPFSLAGMPALVQCTGFSAEGLPLHWQVVANRGDEASVLRVAAAYEAATPWRARRPALPADRAEEPVTGSKPVLAARTAASKTNDELHAFAQRHGLAKLAPQHLHRLRELAETTAAAGASLPRVATKEEGLPSTFRLAEP